MPYVVNNGIPGDPQSPAQSQQAPVNPATPAAETPAPENNVFDQVPAQEATPESKSQAEENVFSNLEEPNPDEKVPLSALQAVKAKERHKAQKQIRDLQQQIAQRDLVLAQVQQGQVQPGNANQQQGLQQPGYTPDQIMTYIEQQAQSKATQQKILEIAQPAYEKFDDFQEVTGDLPWSADMILAAKNGDFIYHLSKQAPQAVLEIANAPTPLEAGVLLKKYKDMWERRSSTKSPDKKTISHADAPPTKVTAGTPGVGASDPKSYEAAKMRTGRFTAYRR